MKDIRLLSTAIINDVPRSPVEGIQTVSDEEAKRLIAAGQAEDAGADVDRDEGENASDGLDRKNKADLFKVAKAEGVTVEGDANKATIIAAIRSHRAPPAPTVPPSLDGLDADALRTIAGDEGVEVGDDDDAAAIRTAIEEHRSTP